MDRRPALQCLLCCFVSRRSVDGVDIDLRPTPPYAHLAGDAPDQDHLDAGGDQRIGHVGERVYCHVDLRRWIAADCFRSRRCSGVITSGFTDQSLDAHGGGVSQSILSAP